MLTEFVCSWKVVAQIDAAKNLRWQFAGPASLGQNQNHNDIFALYHFSKTRRSKQRASCASLYLNGQI
jgi:hypothetical protein